MDAELDGSGAPTPASLPYSKEDMKAKAQSAQHAPVEQLLRSIFRDVTVADMLEVLNKAGARNTSARIMITVEKGKHLGLEGAGA